MRMTPHALQRMAERGILAEEVVYVLDHGTAVATRGSREAKVGVLQTGYSWRGRSYPHKRVQVVYTKEDGELLVLAVIAQYGEWGLG